MWPRRCTIHQLLVSLSETIFKVIKRSLKDCHTYVNISSTSIKQTTKQKSSERGHVKGWLIKAPEELWYVISLSADVKAFSSLSVCG